MGPKDRAPLALASRSVRTTGSAPPSATRGGRARDFGEQADALAKVRSRTGATRPFVVGVLGLERWLPRSGRESRITAERDDGSGGGADVRDVMERVLEHWGYLALAIGAAIEGEGVVILGATLAHRGTIDVRGVVLAAFAGSVCGDQTWYWIGRRYGARVLASRPRWSERAARASERMRRWGDAYVVVFRFLYGLRTLSPLLLGMSGLPPLRFACLNVIGAAMWSGTITGAGWALGSAVEAMLGRVARVEEVVVLGVVLVVVGVAVARARARRRTRGEHDATPPTRDDRRATSAQ